MSIHTATESSLETKPSILTQPKAVWAVFFRLYYCFHGLRTC